VRHDVFARRVGLTILAGLAQFERSPSPPLPLGLPWGDVSVQPAACLDRLLPAASAICVAQAGQKVDRGLAAGGNRANAGLRGGGPR
jgi:hypothetical protein